MPSFPEIAYVRTPTGALIPALVPIGNSLQPEFQAAFTDASDDISLVDSFGDLLDHWLVAGDEPEWNNQSLLLPTRFTDENLGVDASEKIDALDQGVTGGVGAYLSWRFTFKDVIPTSPVSDYIVTLSRLWTNSVLGSDPARWLILAPVNPRQTPRAGHPEDKFRTTWIDNRPTGDARLLAQFKNQIMASRRVLVEATFERPEEFELLYPEIPGPTETAIWCRAAPVFGDFAALAITGQDVLQSVASKSVTLTTEYHPDLEDLDNTVRYGSDSLGRAVVWRVLSTNRTDRFIDLNLSAAAL